MNKDGVSISFELITDELKRVADDKNGPGSNLQNSVKDKTCLLGLGVVSTLFAPPNFQLLRCAFFKPQLADVFPTYPAPSSYSIEQSAESIA